MDRTRLQRLTLRSINELVYRNSKEQGRFKSGIYLVNTENEPVINIRYLDFGTDDGSMTNKGIQHLGAKAREMVREEKPTFTLIAAPIVAVGTDNKEMHGHVEQVPANAGDSDFSELSKKLGHDVLDSSATDAYIFVAQDGENTLIFIHLWRRNSDGVIELAPRGPKLMDHSTEKLLSDDLFQTLNPWSDRIDEPLPENAFRHDGNVEEVITMNGRFDPPGPKPLDIRKAFGMEPEESKS